MNKTELVAAIAEKAELSKKDSEKALTAFVEAVTEASSLPQAHTLADPDPPSIATRVEVVATALTGFVYHIKDQLHSPLSTPPSSSFQSEIIVGMVKILYCI